MIILLLATAIYGQHIIFQDDFSSGKFDSTLWKAQKVATIVPCPKSTNNDQCLNIISKSYGGGLYSQPFDIENGQDVTIEFKYLTKSTKYRGSNSGLFVGYTDKQQSGYCWFASGYSYTSDFFKSNSQKSSPQYLCPNDESVLIQDLLDDWKTIKYTIPASTLKSKNQEQLSLVFEDFQDGNTEGTYYITQILVYYSRNCTAKCKECTTFYSCTSCEEPYQWLEGKCYNVDCGDSLEKSIPYGSDSLVESVTTTSYSAVIKIYDTYDFNICWPAQWVTLGYQDGKFTELPFWYDTATTAKLTIDQSNISNYNCEQSENTNIYQCFFHFNVHFNEQIMYERNWTATIDYSKSKVENKPVAPRTLNLPALAIPIETEIEYCTNINDCQWTNGSITLTLNQKFKVKLTVLDSNLKSWTMTQGEVKLSGKGTLAPMPILDVNTETPGTIIYTVRLGIKGEQGNGFVVTALITKPNARRRLLASQTDTGAKLAVAKLESGSIKFKLRDLVIEDNPEYGYLAFAPIILILILGF